MRVRLRVLGLGGVGTPGGALPVLRRQPLCGVSKTRRVDCTVHAGLRTRPSVRGGCTWCIVRLMLASSESST